MPPHTNRRAADRVTELAHSGSSEEFTEAVVKAEDAWVLQSDAKNRQLDQAILIIALQGGDTLPIAVPSEPTLFVPNNWQEGLADDKTLLGSTTAKPPCVKGVCTKALENIVIEALRAGRRAATTVAFDALDAVHPSGNVLELQGHVYCVLCDYDTFYCIEPTPNPPWFAYLNNLLIPIMQRVADEASVALNRRVRYLGVREGESYDHHHLCRYKVATDAMLPPPKTLIDFRVEVSRIVRELQTFKHSWKK